MPKKELVIVFTRDKLETLTKTLFGIQDTDYVKYVIDDSVVPSNRHRIYNLCKQIPRTNYLGKEEFNRFISRQGLSISKFDFLLRQLGNNGWNLGYARNFALLYSKAIGAERVLFMDDDIQVQNLKLIEELFESIDHFNFVGANILGLVDDSVLGHIATEFGVLNERMLSGGFMAFNPNAIDHYFINSYNEDWIWLFLNLKQDAYLQTGEVFQEINDPLTNYRSKVIFQEEGEIALDGVLDLFKAGSYDSLIRFSFWERMLEERKEYLKMLLDRAAINRKTDHQEIIEFVLSNHENFNALYFSRLFEKYFSNHRIFERLFRSL